jgi:hypothetical protein
MTFTAQQHRPGPLGSLDGDGAGDHDRTYRFGWRPRASVPYAGEVEAGGSPRSAALHGVDALAAAA